MPEPEGYCYIKAPEESRDVARNVKNERGETWADFLEAAAEALENDTEG